MSTIAARLSQVVVGKPLPFQNLTLYPLLAEGPAQPGYRFLDVALAIGSARITEVSAGGSVPELRFVNDGELPILLLDGEELIGAKQNRILNLTILAPALKSIVIPVSCVEAGRWRAQSAEFGSARRAHFAAGRARKAADVSDSLRRRGTRESDQGRVWADIQEKSRRFGIHSATAAAAALYEGQRERLDDFQRAFVPQPSQCGALFAINGRLVGLDLFDSPATLAAALPKLVESHALDAIDLAGDPLLATAVTPESWLQAIAHASVERFPAVGEGEDWRLSGANLAGGALVKEGQLIHLCAFHLPDTDDHPDHDSGGPGRRGPRPWQRGSLAPAIDRSEVTPEASVNSLLTCLDSPQLAAHCQASLAMPRALAAELGRSAVAAYNQGWYLNSQGERVNWREAVAQAIAAKVSLPPEAALQPVPSPLGARGCGLPSTRIQVANETTLMAARRLRLTGVKVLALNFANGVHPGGGFLSGSRAQEEVLCRSSALHATLYGDPMYLAHQARPLPDSTDWAILSPQVPVFRTDDGTPHDEPWRLDFLTCAAPYAPALGQPLAGDLLQARIDRVLAIAQAYGYAGLILGAWGCGAFGNDPARTARDFHNALARDYAGVFDEVVFAITDWSPERRYLAPFAAEFRKGI